MKKKESEKKKPKSTPKKARVLTTEELKKIKGGMANRNVEVNH